MADYETKDGIGGTPAPAAPEFEYTSKWLRENTQIHGWLTFFLIVMMIGGVVSVVMGLIDMGGYGNGWLMAADVVLPVEMLAVAIYSVYLFATRKRGAVFFAKVYVVGVLLSNVIVLISGPDYYSNATRLVSSIIWSCIWFTYLTLSDQVGEIIPKPFRKVSKIDISLVGSVVLIPVVLLIIGVFSLAINDYLSDAEEEFSEIPVAWNERNDGRVIFKIPDGFTCDEDVYEEDGVRTIYYQIENEEIGSGTIFSVYDYDTSISYFEECADLFKEDDPEATICNVEQSTTYINGRECYYRITTYEYYGIYVHWRFYFLFDKKLGKIFLASLYDYGDDTSYVSDLLYSVKFEKP